MTAELERYKTLCVAQEAEIARLKHGLDELKEKMSNHIADRWESEHDRGWYNSCCFVLNEINRITGE